jgi:hypothetical protein
MTLAAALSSLDAALAGSRVGVRGDALLAPVASACLEMVRAYRADADAFAARGDTVNALASVAYAAGWLDAATALGLLDGDGSPAPLVEGAVPPDDTPRLAEKAGRYVAMLENAVGSAVPAPDEASPLHAAALAVLAVADAFARPAATLLACGALEASLSASSYAYGWLDAGVRAGLVGIAGDRSLFAV